MKYRRMAMRSAHDSWDYARISCRESFITTAGRISLIARAPSFLRLVQTGLENLMQNRAGLRGRFKEFLRATSVADQIDRYRIRVNELRSNFIVGSFPGQTSDLRLKFP